jgi:hypothetical protein
MDNVRLIGGSLLVMLIVLIYLVGMGPLMQTMYDCHLWPRPSTEEVQYVIMRGTAYDSISCQYGENGWEYICYATSGRRTGKAILFRLGVMGGAYPVVRHVRQLPLDGPIPSRDAYVSEAAPVIPSPRWLLRILILLLVVVLAFRRSTVGIADR